MGGFPTAVTLVRLALSPVFAAVFTLPAPWGPAVSFAVAAAIELSDLLDGLAARRWSQVTELGKLLDPLADSVARLTMYACFASRGLVPVWVFLLLMYRDAAVAFTRTLCAYRHEVLSARASGKVKAWFQAGGELVILGGCLAAGSWERRDGYVIAGAVVAAATAVSGLDYVWSNRRALRISTRGE